MDNNKPCCGNCMNKITKELGSDNSTLYCEIKERRVSPDGLCQWHELDWNKHE